MMSAGVPQPLPVVELDEHRAARSRHGLVARCLDGDESAWVDLVRRYERLVYSVALRQGLTVDDAADVTQTVFEALFVSLPRLRDDEKLASWLVSVTQRQASRARQRRLREVSLSGLDTDADLQEVEALTGIGVGDALEESLWLYEALQELPEPCRTLLFALYFDPNEPTYAEVALHLKRPVGSIGPTRARCLGHLRRVLQARQDLA
jgi:RNA polymerase sigma factor (sigma-70 family)